MTIPIDNLNPTARRCYNSDAVEAALHRDAAQAAARAKAQKRSDREAIMAIAEARGIAHLGRLWVEADLGDLRAFKAALAGRSKRLRELFGNLPIR
jgi:hypothetical protein